MSRLFLLIPLLALELSTSLSAQSRHSPSDKAGPGLKCGPIVGQLFQCAKFGFIVKVPFGWVDRTEEMQGKSDPAASGAVRQTAEQPGSEVLLAVFERPPEVFSDTINSAVVISVEPLASYPGIKSAVDYLGLISDLARDRGFTPAADPYPFVLHTRRLIRGDFSRPQGKLTMWQSSLVAIENHSILAFTFIGGSDEETDDLIEQLKFSPSKPK